MNYLYDLLVLLLRDVRLRQCRLLLLECSRRARCLAQVGKYVALGDHTAQTGALDLLKREVVLRQKPCDRWEDARELRKVGVMLDIRFLASFRCRLLWRGRLRS